MCDYSLHTAKSRPAKVGDKLVTRNFNTGTRGFAAPEDAWTAVCVLPGTELAFTKEVRSMRIGLFGCKMKKVEHTTAIFRQRRVIFVGQNCSDGHCPPPLRSQTLSL